jgi:hypothetical protein
LTIRAFVLPGRLQLIRAGTFTGEPRPLRTQLGQFLGRSLALGER